MAKAKVAKRYVIHGRVQGVGFRYFAERVANGLGLAGSVRNRWDGTVEVYAIGDAESLEAFKRQLEKGPPSARVSHVEESEEDANAQATRFVIRDNV